MRTIELFHWIAERHSIYLRRQQGLPKPWTEDPILQSYRFCNPFRENDKVTRWIAHNWRDPNTHDPDVWFAMTVARLVNWPDSLELVGYPVPWKPEHFIRVLEARKKAGEKVFTGAYLVRADATPDNSKVAYLAKNVFSPMWEDRAYLRPMLGELLKTFHQRLLEFHDMGSFIAGQIVCDTKYTQTLDFASDWWDWAASGPGSRRGLARVYERPVNYAWKEQEWFDHLTALRTELRHWLTSWHMPPMHAQDLQNCLCEFDKYERVRLNEGRPRSRYAGL